MILVHPRFVTNIVPADEHIHLLELPNAGKLVIMSVVHRAAVIGGHGMVLTRLKLQLWLRQLLGLRVTYTIKMA
jgi:hypothetical protein